MNSSDFIVIDIETCGGSFETIPVGFELLIAGLRRGDTYEMYTSHQASLNMLVDGLSKFTNPVVTFNGNHFDIPILDRYCQKVLNQPLIIHNHYDLLTEIVKIYGRRISLDRVCQYTFGDTKISWDHRRNAEVWANAPERLVDYNKRDLDLTHELFLRVLRQERLFLGDSTILLPLP